MIRMQKERTRETTARSSQQLEVTRAPPLPGGSGRSLPRHRKRRLIRRSTLNRTVPNHHPPPRPNIASLRFLHSAAIAAARAAGSEIAPTRASVARAITITGINIECLTRAVRETCKRGTKRRRSSRKRMTTLTKRATTSMSTLAVVSSSTTRGISSESLCIASTALATRGGARPLLYQYWFRPSIVPSCTRSRFFLLLHIISATCTLRNGRCR